MAKGKILVEIDIGREFDELKKELEDNRKDWFPVGGDMISIDNAHLKIDPLDDSFYLFKCRGIIEED